MKNIIFALVVILALGLISALVCRGFFGKEGIDDPIKFNLVLLFSVVTLAYWMYASGFIAYIGNVVSYALSITASNTDSLETTIF